MLCRVQDHARTALRGQTNQLPQTMHTTTGHGQSVPELVFVREARECVNAFLGMLEMHVNAVCGRSISACAVVAISDLKPWEPVVRSKMPAELYEQRYM